jgi:ABC-2 type transport system permease protein
MAAADGIPVRTRRPPALRLLAAQIGYQLRLLVRSPLASFATLVIPLMVLLAVNLLYRGTPLASRGGIAYAQFFTPAMVAFAVVNACYMAVISSITLARDEGILKRVRSTPLPPWVYMAGRIASAPWWRWWQRPSWSRSAPRCTTSMSWGARSQPRF